MIANIRFALLVAALLPGAAQCHPPAAAPSYDAPAGPARLLEGMGSYSLPIGTSVPDAQRFFDQGLMLAWGFNFDGARRSFREAARLDPECAMCRWGLAYAAGPSLNHELAPEQAAQAREALAEALARAPRARARERGLIEALARRHLPARAGRDALDAAYADAMRALAQRFARDADVLTLAADALMSPRGRDYWGRDGKPQPWTPEILALLERAIALAPDHPGARHLYIHALEESPQPRRALDSAERLARLAPGVGHLVHMPAHIYFRLGRYAEAIAANKSAIAADRAYLEDMPGDPGYIAGYLRHNQHFLWAAAMMGGRSNEAAAAAGELARYAADESGRAAPDGTLQHFAVLPLLTRVRFAEWDAIVDEPRPAIATPYTEGVWSYARAMAFVRGGELVAARTELAALAAARRRAALEAGTLQSTHPLASLLAIAERLLEAELDAASARPERAIAQARAAVSLEAALERDEPPAWLLPARHTLGALLLAAGRRAEAGRVYREDLRIYPANKWALAGLAESGARASARP